MTVNVPTFDDALGTLNPDHLGFEQQDIALINAITATGAPAYRATSTPSSVANPRINECHSLLAPQLLVQRLGHTLNQAFIWPLHTHVMPCESHCR